MSTPLVGLAKPAVGSPAISPDNYTYLQGYLYRESGIVLEADKHYLIEARLIPLIRTAKLASLDDLCQQIRLGLNPALSRSVIDAMTTNETLFFRDQAHYDVLKTTIIPALVEKRRDSRILRFWSAASSSGQEAYSLVMQLIETGLGDWTIDVLGTDISDHILERARTGRFMQIEVNRGLPVTHLVKYFVKHGMDWQLKDVVRNRVRFERFDLRRSMTGMGPFDVVFCRNVLIYFDQPTKEQIIRSMRRTINTGGHLLLGGAESLRNADDIFVRQTIGQAVVYRAI
jgi:chemotaxis protein methyltransferase CheR